MRRKLQVIQPNLNDFLYAFHEKSRIAHVPYCIVPCGQTIGGSKSGKIIKKVEHTKKL